MVKKGLLLCLFAVIFQNAFSQNKRVLDSLSLVYKNAKHDTVKIWVLADIAWQYRNTRPDTAVTLGNQILSLSDKILFQKGILQAYQFLEQAYRSQGNYATSLVFAKKSLEKAQYLKDKKNEALALYGLGINYDYQANYPIAIDYFFKSLQIREKLKDLRGVSACYNSLGIIYQSQKEYDKSTEYFYKSL